MCKDTECEDEKTKDFFENTFFIVFHPINFIPFLYYSSFLQCSAWNQTGSHIAILFASSLPPKIGLIISLYFLKILLRHIPIWIILADDMQDVSLGKRQSGLLTRNVFVIYRVVIKKCPESDSRLA